MAEVEFSFAANNDDDSSVAFDLCSASVVSDVAALPKAGDAASGLLSFASIAPSNRWLGI